MGEALGEASTLRDAHVSPEQLARRKAGRLTPDENALIERHLARCEGCRMATRLSDPFVATVETSPPLAAAKAGLAPTFSARYEIKRTLGSGGTGTVYEALDLQLHRLVALKLLRLAPADPAELEEAANRLVREARAMAALHHRNVVTVYDVGRHEDQVYVAMQLVDGPTLRGWLANGTRTVPEILGVLRDAGVGLAAAHRAVLFA